MTNNESNVESIVTDMEDEIRLEIAELDDESLDDVIGGVSANAIIEINFGCR